MLLGDILRTDWRFPGFVVSDCDAIDDFSQPRGHHYSADHEHGSAAGVLAGTDLDCGTAYNGLVNAVHQNLIAEKDIDVAVKRLFTARMKLGMFDPPASVPFSSIPFSDVHLQASIELALRAARESMVLLKNEGATLPLKPKTEKTIAVIGPLAASRVALEGNYNAIPMNPILPVDGIEKEFGAAHVLYSEGSPYVMGGEVPVPRTILRTAPGSSEQGLKAEYFAQPTFDGSPETTRTDKEIDFDWAFANPVPSLSNDSTNQAFAVRWTGAIVAPKSDTYNFQMRLPVCAPCGGKVSFALYIDGKKLEASAPAAADTKLPPSGRSYGAMQRFAVPLDTNPHELRIEYVQTGRINNSGISFEWLPPHELLRDEAAALASKADVVVAFVGLTARLEGEEMKVNAKGFSGGDRTSIDLPDVQQELLETVAKSGKPMVVVLLNGSALAVNWAAQNARAILEAWYPGEAGGQAIAETLSGRNNPAGRLPVTFYRGIDELPAFDDYSMANRTYRYFKGKPLFAFGDGLSYTTFAYSNVKLSAAKLKAGDTLTVEADVKNTGAASGDEVAELYLMPPHTAVSPQLALAGFQRPHLDAGETKHIVFHLDPRTLSQVDAQGTRAVSPGHYRISLGGSQPTGLHAENFVWTDFTIEGTHPIER
jgi:beta-glucosidase